MQILKMFQIDAFSRQVFKGNPAAVVPTDRWLAEEVMQKIAAENNLAETAFVVPEDDGYGIRWFTPRFEVPLCGHATLAAAHVLMKELKTCAQEVRFSSQSGPLSVTRDGELLRLDFPAMPYCTLDACPEPLLQGLGLSHPPVAVLQCEKDPNYFVILDNQTQIATLNPDMSLLEKLHPAGVVVSAPGEMHDCVSRYFLPSFGIPEDPVTGSIHCVLVPYWQQRLGLDSVRASQLSERGGELFCQARDGRVSISGYASKYLEGHIVVA